MIRPYLEMGAAMGWSPGAVRACSLGDFAAALDGWLLANGAGSVDGAPISAGVDLTAEDYRGLLRELAA